MATNRNKPSFFLNFFLNTNIFLKLFFIFFVAALDQLSKCLAECFIDKTFVVNDYFNLVLLYNKGVSFSLLASDYWCGKAFIVGVSILLIVLVCKLMISARSNWEVYGYIFIVGGAIGNLIDRLLRKGVVDFLDFHIKGYHWPAFNVADSFIVVGAFLIVLCKIMEKNIDKNIKDIS